MSRTITILGLIQVLLIIMGFFGLGVVMKWNGYPDEAFGIQWYPLALMLRQHGLLLLLVPVFWTVFAAVSERRQRFVFTVDIWAALGIIFAFTIITLFLYACVHPFYRPMIIHL